MRDSPAPVCGGRIGVQSVHSQSFSVLEAQQSPKMFYRHWPRRQQTEFLPYFWGEERINELAELEVIVSFEYHHTCKALSLMIFAKSTSFSAKALSGDSRAI